MLEPPIFFFSINSLEERRKKEEGGQKTLLSVPPKKFSPSLPLSNGLGTCSSLCMDSLPLNLCLVRTNIYAPPFVNC
ncbi:hypothetical protein F8388_008606 [Cannabis sativa]|uniref:Uncharacterized protein n=1 Tax=Cannabis sativa TaxID=3483 RepID=A0A7J6FLS4_CANSA|nr:hypothetical protein F8388_008606 [Cannabis sativa]